MIFVNFKNYPQAMGDNALLLIRIIEDVAKDSQLKIIPVVEPSEFKLLVGKSFLELWTQKVENEQNLTELSDMGLSGTFLNHSMYKLDDFEELKNQNEKAKSLSIKTLIFSDTVEDLSKIGTIRPDFLAYEPPELIESPDLSVASAKAESISQASVITKDLGIPLIVGAGIKSSDDIRKSMSLGAVGVAVSSAVVTSLDPKSVLLELAEGFK